MFHAQLRMRSIPAILVLLLVLVGIALPTVRTPGVLAAGRVSIQPGSVLPGTSVTLKGTRFPKSTVGSVTWQADGTVLATVTTDARGSFSIVFNAPQVAAGTYQVGVTIGDASNGSSITILPTDATAPAVTVIQGETPPATSTTLAVATASTESTQAALLKPTLAATATPTVEAAPVQNQAITPTKLNFGASADARIEAANPALNFGTQSLKADGGADPAVDSLLKFTVKGVTGAVTNAYLQVYVAAGTANGPAIASASNNWTEAGVTWGNRPARTSILMSDLGAVATGTWAKFDVTKLFTADGIYTFQIVGTNPDGIQFNNRELRSNVPRLYVTFGSGSPAPSPTPIPAVPATATKTPATTSTPAATVTTAPASATATVAATATATDGPATTSTPAATATTAPASATATTAGATATASPTSVSGVIFTDGFESGSLVNWTTGAGAQLTTSQVASGAHAVRLKATGNGGFLRKWLPAPTTSISIRTRFYLVNMGGTSQFLARVSDATGTVIGGVFVDTNGMLRFRNTLTGVSTSAGPAVSANAWHELQLKMVVNGASGTTEVWLDGTRVSLLSITTNLGTVAVQQAQIGDSALSRTFEFIFDDVSFATNTQGTLGPVDGGTGAPAATATPIPGATDSLSFPIRATFYYPWFPEAWEQSGIYPYTNYNPSSGFYDGTDPDVIKRHISDMQYGRIQVGISSWWGQATRSDGRVPTMLRAADGTGFKWSIYYEAESQGNPTVAQLQDDLTYIRDNYGKDPNFLRVDGKFVIFVYTDGTDACGMADRWKEANTVGAYVVLKVFTGYKTCASQPQSWHQYAPAKAVDHQAGFSYGISPGFWLKGDVVRLARDKTRFAQNVRDMVASGEKWQLVISYNEWGEGTSVESADEWASASGRGIYLDLLHNNGQGTIAAIHAVTLASVTPFAMLLIPVALSAAVWTGQQRRREARSRHQR